MFCIILGCFFNLVSFEMALVVNGQRSLVLTGSISIDHQSINHIMHFVTSSNRTNLMSRVYELRLNVI